MGKKLGLEVVFAAKFRLASGAAEKFEDELSLELRRKDSSLTSRHLKVSWHGPVNVMLLVQRQGRTTLLIRLVELKTL